MFGENNKINLNNNESFFSSGNNSIIVNKIFKSNYQDIQSSTSQYNKKVFENVEKFMIQKITEEKNVSFFVWVKNLRTIFSLDQKIILYMIHSC